MRGGSDAARDRLAARYLPILKRWAHSASSTFRARLGRNRRLGPGHPLRALDRIDSFEPRREGAFLAYLRRILLNALRDEIRRTARAPGAQQLTPDLRDDRPSLLEEAIGRDAVEAYEEALASLPELHQEAVILRVEFEFTYEQTAGALASPSGNAARTMVSRALLRLAEAMSEHRSSRAFPAPGGAVADRTRVDWGTECQVNPSLAPTVKRLELLDSIRRVKSAAIQEPATQADSGSRQPPSILFRWGPLLVLEQIGLGSFGEVYRAIDSRLDREVALKLRR